MISWLLHTVAAISALMLAVLVVRRPVARWFGAGPAYALWAVPALRVVVPPLALFRPDFELPAAAAFVPAAMGRTAPLPAALAGAGPGQWVPFLLATWAGGAVIFLVLQWLAYRAFLRRLDGSSRPARPPRYGGILTFVSRAVEGPLALGLVERRIVVPDDFSRRYSESERRLALQHELTHHRRGDIWCNMAAMLLLAANWWNPIAWIAFRAFRTDQELACDAAVAGRASDADRSDYARAMVKSAARPGLIAACSMNDAADLKRRLRMMRLHRASMPRRAGGLAAVSALALTAFTLGTPEARESVAALVPAAAASPARLAAAAPVSARPVRLASAVRLRRAAAPRLARDRLRDTLEPSRPLLASLDIQPRLAPLTLSLPPAPPAAAPRPRLFLAAAPAPVPARLRTAFVVTDSGVYVTGLSEEDRTAIRAAVAEARREAASDAQIEQKTLHLAHLDDGDGGTFTLTVKVKSDKGD
jgi:beta-lactamase regulating signal transducer with metallopeptidase domain